MATLIDSSVRIAAERGDLDLSNVLPRYAEEDVANLGDYRFGALALRSSGEDRSTTPSASGIRRGIARAAPGDRFRSYGGAGTCFIVG
ncbi:MAG TPA: hypothetical protein VGI36_03125 [Candidatus Binataceae bacterium]|jgi:hypothetical protein